MSACTQSVRLPLPDEHASLETLAESDAVQLFVDRASAARRDFRLSAENADGVAAVCRRLDGVPLALELAAARVTALHPSQIAARLDERFKLLERGTPQCRRATPDLAGHDRLVVRPPHARRTRGARPPRGVRGRVHARRRRSGHRQR